MNPEPKEAIYFARFESDGGQTGTVIHYTDSHSSIFEFYNWILEQERIVKEDGYGSYVLIDFKLLF